MAKQFPVPKMVRFIEEHIEAAHATSSNMMRKSGQTTRAIPFISITTMIPSEFIAPKGKGWRLLRFEGERVGKNVQSQVWLCEGTGLLPDCRICAGSS